MPLIRVLWRIWLKIYLNNLKAWSHTMLVNTPKIEGLSTSGTWGIDTTNAFIAALKAGKEELYNYQRDFANPS